MPMISVEFDLPLPNEFLVDHSFSEGKTRKYTYYGPDKIYLQISEETGKEVAGPLTEEDKADGRPIPEGAYLYEVDCVTNPLLCQLRAPIVDELQERYTEEVWHPQSLDIEGYERFGYALPLMPNDVFDSRTLRIVDGKPVYDSFTASRKLVDKDELLTWEDVRQHRDQLLSGSDSRIAEDMPESLKDAWKEYRQKLRDLPAVMEANGIPPSIAYYMFPLDPTQV